METKDDEISALKAKIDNLQSQVDELAAALKGVIRVADRKTDEFDAARAAIAKAEGESA
jgi:peptidoglycan hydrolase CwlO-like protein